MHLNTDQPIHLFSSSYMFKEPKIYLDLIFPPPTAVSISEQSTNAAQCVTTDPSSNAGVLALNTIESRELATLRGLGNPLENARETKEPIKTILSLSLFFSLYPKLRSAKLPRLSGTIRRFQIETRPYTHHPKKCCKSK